MPAWPRLADLVRLARLGLADLVSACATVGR